jgi:hypothetical protein
MNWKRAELRRALQRILNRWFRLSRTELWLFLLLWLTYAYFYQSTSHNEAARFDQMRAIVQDHALRINKYWWNSADVIHYYQHGQDYIYPNKAPGMALLCTVPFGLLWGLVLVLKAIGLPAWFQWHALVYLTTIFTVSLLSVVAAVAIYRALQRMSGSSYFSVLAVLGIWLGTLVFPFSTIFFSHQFTAALLAIAFYLLFEVGHGEAISSREQLIVVGLAGVLMSFAVASEYPAVLPVALLSIYGARLLRRSELPTKGKLSVIAAWACGIWIGGGTLLAYNLIAFGKPLYIPYEAYAAKGAYFSATYSRGWLGLHWPNLTQFLDAFRTIAFSSQIGMLHLHAENWFVYACNPVLWLALPGLAAMIWKREWRAEALLVIAMIAAYVLFVTSYGFSAYDWCGAVYFGSRHLIPLLPFLALPLCFGARLLRFVFYPLLALSIFYMLLDTAIEPRVPYPRENAARDMLVPDYVRGRFAQNSGVLFDDPRPVTKDSTAFNLGKLVRLPAAFQLTPLLAWWLVAGTALFSSVTRGARSDQPIQLVLDKAWAPEERRPWPRWAATVLGLFVAAINLPPVIHSAAATLRHPVNGLLGKYYRNANWSGQPVEVQIDSEVNFDWSKSLPLLPPFSVEWTGNILIEQNGDYTFALIADDGASLTVDGRMVVDARQALLQKKTGTITLTAGLHPIQVRYFNVLFGGSVRLSWIQTGHPEQIVPEKVLVPPHSAPLPNR